MLGFLGTAALAAASGLGALEGAIKVCVRYERGRSQKLRCSQWTVGPGYVQGPHDYEEYFIPEVRSEAGIRRAYRYRKSLPYNPKPGLKLPNTPVNIKAAEKTQEKYDSIANDVVKMKLLSAAQVAKLSGRFVDESLPVVKDVLREEPPKPVLTEGVVKGRRKKKS